MVTIGTRRPLSRGEGRERWSTIYGLDCNDYGPGDHYPGVKVELTIYGLQCNDYGPGDHYPGVKVDSEGLPSMAYSVTIMDEETTIQG